jgi:hypothetical protein
VNWLAREELRSFTLSDSSEEEEEGKNVDYEWTSRLSGHWAKHKQAADHLQKKQFARTIGDGPRAFEEETIP